MADKTPPEEQKGIHIQVVKQLVTLSTSGFGLVAALAWNNVIQEFVNTYVKKYLAVGSGLISLFIYAILITVIAVIVTYQLSSLLQKIEKK